MRSIWIPIVGIIILLGVVLYSWAVNLDNMDYNDIDKKKEQNGNKMVVGNDERIVKTKEKEKEKWP